MDNGTKINPGTKETVDNYLNPVSKRNIAIGTVCIILSLGSLVLILTRKLKRSIKICLLNLTACDITVMCSGIVYSVINMSTANSNSLSCQVACFCVSTSFLLCHASVAGISLNNFLAVWYPHKYNVWITTKSLLLSILFGWLGLGLISATSFIGFANSGRPCVLLAITPRYCVIGYFVILCFFDSCVFGLNLSLYIRVQRHWKRVGVQNVNSASNEAVTEPTNTGDPDESPSRQSTSAPASIAAAVSASHNANYRGANASASISTNASANAFDAAPFHTHRDSAAASSHVAWERHKGIVVESDTREIELPISSPTLLKPPDTGLRKSRLTKMLFHGKKSTDGESLKPINRLATFVVFNECTTNENNKNKKLRALSTSMTIISLCCLTLKLPFLLFLFYVGVLAEDRMKANYSPFGIFSTTLLIINVIGDAFLYAWRFIQWKCMCLKLFSYCRPSHTE